MENESEAFMQMWWTFLAKNKQENVGPHQLLISHQSMIEGRGFQGLFVGHKTKGLVRIPGIN